MIDASGIIRYRSPGDSYTTRYDPVALAAVIDLWVAQSAVDPGDRGGVPDVTPGALVLGAPRQGAGVIRVDLRVDRAGPPASARLFSVTGEMVRTLLPATAAAAVPGHLTWDQRDTTGRLAAPGIYFIEVRQKAERVVRRIAVGVRE